ncbi:hypothetical protein Tco_0401256 [Tanacetum coccineum]
MHEASNATKNDGIQLGKDGKPLHNPKGGPIKPILKTGKVTVAGESIIASKSGPMQQGSFFVEPSLSTSNEPSTQEISISLLWRNMLLNTWANSMVMEHGPVGQFRVIYAYYEYLEKLIPIVKEDGSIYSVSNRKKKGKNHGKSTRIDGIKFTKPKASFYQEKKGPKSTANQSKASTSSSIPGKNSTSVSNFFDTLCNLEEEGVNDPKGKNEETSQSRFFETSKGPSDTYDSPNVNMAGGTRVSKANKCPSTRFINQLGPECINEYDTNEDDIESSNGPLFRGGNQLED